MSESLGDALPREVKRCQELVAVYKSLGPVGAFGAAAIQANIARALKAMIEQDTVAMIAVYQDLKEHK